MSIIIRYEGSLDEPRRIRELILDLKLRCRQLEWSCEEVNERIIGEAYYHQQTYGGGGGLAILNMMSNMLPQKTVDDRMRGVYIQPPDSDTFMLTFNRTGHLMHYMALPGEMKITETEFGNAMSYSQEPGYYLESDGHWIKTTGDVSAHILIVALLRHLQKTYISNLEVTDQTDFWDTLDFKRLELEHGRMNAMLTFFRNPDNMKSILKSIGIEDVEGVTAIPLDDIKMTFEKPDHMKEWGLAAHEN
jgi:hypothetical protein